MGIGPLLGSVFAAMLLAQVAWAGSIEGTVALTPADLGFRGGGKPNAYVGQLSGSAGRSGSVVVADTAYGVAYVADLVEKPDPQSKAVLLDQSGQRFVPRILAILVGQSVEFRNSDNVFHNVFSYSPPKRFDLGRYPRGRSATLTFEKPGLVQIFCDIHSHMRADLVVVPNRWFAYVGSDGRFRIDGIPAGARTLSVWLPQRGVRSVVVESPEEGSASVTVGSE